MQHPASPLRSCGALDFTTMRTGALRPRRARKPATSGRCCARC